MLHPRGKKAEPPNAQPQDPAESGVVLMHKGVRFPSSRHCAMSLPSGRVNSTQGAPRASAKTTIRGSVSQNSKHEIRLTQVRPHRKSWTWATRMYPIGSGQDVNDLAARQHSPSRLKGRPQTNCATFGAVTTRTCCNYGQCSIPSRGQERGFVNVAGSGAVVWKAVSNRPYPVRPCAPKVRRLMGQKGSIPPAKQKHE